MTFHHVGIISLDTENDTKKELLYCREDMARWDVELQCDKFS